MNELKLKIDEAIRHFLTQIKPKTESPGLIELHRAMGYSLTSGGNRLRPLLTCLTAQALGADVEKVLSFAVAVELVHTYSLIHDDLPAMDNDDFRRGQPSNHKVFGESLAILAGDALCTEPYALIARDYKSNPELALNLIGLLTEAAGFQGMVGGQAIDIFSKEKDLSQADVEFLHGCKTVALFAVAINGAAAIAGAGDQVKSALQTYAQSIGLMFQIADDIHDGHGKTEPSFVKVVGLEKARKHCQKLKDQALQEIQVLGPKAEPLVNFAQLIFERTRDVF